MISNKQTTIAVSTIAIAAAIVLFASGPLGATHQAQAQILICQSTDTCDVNPSTGNPHPPAVPPDPNPGTSEVGNPHSGACSGNPHGQVGADTCHGSK
jgi:hypothetical protein